MSIRIGSSGRDDDVQILLDRQSALDIGAFVVDGVDLSPGIAIPSDGDRRIDHALQGFFFTCGPDHIRHPEPIAAGEGEKYPLHGSFCGTPVTHTRMASEKEPLGCSAEMELRLADGAMARMSRRWTIDAETREVMLSDKMTNIGETPFAPMLMYHMNIAGRLLDDDTHIGGSMFAGEKQAWRFGDGESAHFCVPATPGSDGGWAQVALGPFAALAGRSLIVRFSVATLPFLQMWRCQRGKADVISIEPVSHRLASRAELSAAGEMPLLQPGKAIDYALAFRIS